MLQSRMMMTILSRQVMMIGRVRSLVIGGMAWTLLVHRRAAMFRGVQRLRGTRDPPCRLCAHLAAPRYRALKLKAISVHKVESSPRPGRIWGFTKLGDPEYGSPNRRVPLIRRTPTRHPPTFGNPPIVRSRARLGGGRCGGGFATRRDT